MAISPEEFTSIIPTMQVAVDISSTDHNLATAFANPAAALSGQPAYYPFARRIWVATGGTFIGRMFGDAADVSRVVPNNTYLDGAWIKVTKTSNTCSGMVAER